MTSPRELSSTRRQFMAGGALAGAALPFVRPAPRWLRAAPKTGNGQILVVLQVRGAWDYLNMIVPHSHPNYIQGRPNIKIAVANTLPLATGRPYAWAAAMQPFKDLFDRGDLAIVHNIGYPNPNLSHFESEKKWYAADPAVSVLQRGWLARWLDNYGGTSQIPAVDIESRLNDAFSGQRVPVMTSAAAFAFDSDTGTSADRNLELSMIDLNARALRPTADPGLQYVAGAIADAYADSQLVQTAAASYVPGATYPTSTLSTRMQLAAALITGNLGADVYLVDTGGFDTHANQTVAGNGHQGTLANLLGDVTGTVKAFLDDMIAHSRGQEVVVMLFSEFSRRVWENGSIGTDHGHGGVAFLAGDPVVGGEYGTFPDLNPATNSQYYIPFNGLSTDFRSLYATVLENWLGVSHQAVLGSAFPLLGAL
jgi:uncharacterized protein (DUF1501 family)